MKKRLAGFTATALATTILMQGGFSSTESAKAAWMEEKFKVDNAAAALSDISNNHSMQVFTLGEVTLPESVAKDLTVTRVTPQDLITHALDRKASKNIKTLVVGKDLVDQYLQPGEFEALDRLLDQGFSVYFSVDGDLQKGAMLTQILRAGQDHATATEIIRDTRDPNGNPYTNNTELGYLWVTKDRNGEYLSGNGYFDASFDEQEKAEKMIVNAWHRQTDSQVTAVVAPAKVKSQIASGWANTAQASSLTDFSIGDGWDTWGWVQENYYSTYGDFTLWRTFADLWHNGSTPYVALVGQGYLDPKDGNQNWELLYGGDMDYYSSSGYLNKLYQYSPMSQPGGTTWSYSIGGGLSGSYGGQSGLSGSISASWTVGVTESDPDVTTVDDSSPTSQTALVHILYKDYDNTWPAPNRDYVIQTSRQDFTVIAQASTTYSSSTGQYTTKMATRYQSYYYPTFDNDKSPNSMAGAYVGWTLNFNKSGN